MVEKKEWSFVWAYPETKFKGYKMLIVYICNDTNCPAKLVIENDYFMELAKLPQGISPLEKLVMNYRFLSESEMKKFLKE